MDSRTSIPARVLVMAGAAATAAAVVAGSGGSAGSAGGAGPTDGTSTTAATSAVVMTHDGGSGTYLTDGSGRTLYVFSADTGPRSTCSGECATEWKPFTSTAVPTARGFTPGADLALTARAGGQQQVTYAGHPLYYFAGDQQPGQAAGQGLNDFGGLWSTVTTDGTPTSTDSSTSSPASGGYYY